MTRILVLALAAALALAACSKPAAPDGSAASAGAAGDGAAPAAAAAAAPGTIATPIPGEPPLPELGEFRIVQVLMGTAVDDEQLVVTDTREFGARDAIHASVLSIGAHQGLKLSADWRAPDGAIIAKSEQALVPESDLATTFRLGNPEPWPAGEYELRLAIDGHTVRTEKFSVR